MNYSVTVWQDTRQKDANDKPIFARIYHQEHPTKEFMNSDFEEKRAIYRAEDGYYVTCSFPG